MPSKNKQINVRCDEETERLMRRLVKAVSVAIGIEVSQSDLFRLGLQELAAKYLPRAEDPPPGRGPSTRRGK